MRQKTLTEIFLLLLITTFFTGCNNEPLKPQAVVLNLRVVADATGINDQIKKRRETLRQQISEEMKALSDKLNNEIEAGKAGLGDSPSEEGEKKIQTLQQEMGKQIFQAQSEGNAKLAKETSEMQQYHLDSIMSVAEIIALEHGASIILKANGVFWSDGPVDITDEVITRMQGSEDVQPADGEQKLNGQATP